MSGYRKHPGCLSIIESEEQQEQHDRVFTNNCSVHGCFDGSGRQHMLNVKHHECGFGDCRGQGVRFRSDADARRHWNKYHREITIDRFGYNLNGDDSDDDGYYSEPA